MLTAQSHGELLLASPLPEITDNASERLLPAGVVGAPAAAMHCSDSWRAGFRASHTDPAMLKVLPYPSLALWQCIWVAAGVPLNFGRKQSRTFAMSMLDDGNDAAWSPPMTLFYPGTPELFVPMPMPYRTSAALAPLAQGGAPQANSSTMSRQSNLSSAGPSKALLRRSAVVKDGHEEQVAAVLRVSMQVHSPGCLHVILHTIGCQAPYLLQNRTAEAFVYRQHNTPDKWCLLPAYTSVGYAWVHIDGASLHRQTLGFVQGSDCVNLLHKYTLCIRNVAYFRVIWNVSQAECCFVNLRGVKSICTMHYSVLLSQFKRFRFGVEQPSGQTSCTIGIDFAS